MAYHGRDADGVHPPIPPTYFSPPFSAGALLWLTERVRPPSMGPHPGAAGLDGSTPPISNSQAGAALSSLRRPLVLGGHADPWPSLRPMQCPAIIITTSVQAS